MGNSPTASLCVRFHVLVMMTLLLSPSNLVHCRGLSDLDDTCGSCYREIGRTVWQIVTGESDTGSRTEDVIHSESQNRSDGLVALLMGVEGRQSREDLECSACWVIVHRLKKRVGISKDVSDGYENFKKRAMLNNGWV